MMSDDEQAAYDAWFRAKVAASLADERSPRALPMRKPRQISRDLIADTAERRTSQNSGSLTSIADI